MRRLLVWLYPPAWRAQFAKEFTHVLERERLTTPMVVDVFMGAVDAWLTPTFRPSLPGWNRRTIRLGSSLVLLLAMLSGGLYALQSSPAQASPRFPVYVAISRQIYPAVTVNLTNLGHPIPHLILSSHFGPYRIDSVRSWRSGRIGPMRSITGRVVADDGAGEVLDLGRLPVGASATVTYYLSRNGIAEFGSGPVPYTIRGYGSLGRAGRPDRSAPLTGTLSHFGSGALPLIRTQPVCGGDELGHMTLSRYQLQGSGSITFGPRSVLTQTFLNCGKPIAHLVISIRLKHTQTDGIIHVHAVLHAGTLVGTQRPIWLRTASTAEVTVYDLGMLPTAGVMVVTAVTSSASSGSGDVVRVYAALSPSGQPDQRSLVYSGADTWSQG